MALPDYYWGEADYEVYSVDNIETDALPTLVKLRLFGTIRGVEYSFETTLVSDKYECYELKADIEDNVLNVWVEKIIGEQDAGVV